MKASQTKGKTASSSAEMQTHASETTPFRIFVCAEMDAKIKRFMERASEDEKLSEKTIKRTSKASIKTAHNTDLVTGNKWGVPSCYDLVINTTQWILSAKKDRDHLCPFCILCKRMLSRGDMNITPFIYCIQAFP